MLTGATSPTGTLSPDEIRTIVEQGLPASRVQGKRILVLTPDATRTAPLPLMVRVLADTLGKHVATLDFMVALGTHQPLSPQAILKLYGLTPGDKQRLLPGSKLMNHRWDLPGELRVIGRLGEDEVEALSGGRFRQGVDVALNRHVLDYDLIVILGPVFPHEVAGFSGGHKYLFPGVSGGELLHFTHWLGAVVTCMETIGIRDTPVRRAIERAADLVPVTRLCLAMVVSKARLTGGAGLAGLYVGETRQTWEQAAALSARLHVRYVDKPFHTVLGTADAMYRELWVAGKVMYKLEPVVADGGRLIIYGKHIDRVSDTWGEQIARIGYHTRDYFLERLDDFADVPLGVLAHSTHVKGLGRMENGVEHPRIAVVLATAIPEAECRRINLGYMDPDAIDIEAYRNREDEGILLVENAGETLYRVGG